MMGRTSDSNMISVVVESVSRSLLPISFNNSTSARGFIKRKTKRNTVEGHSSDVKIKERGLKKLEEPLEFIKVVM